MNYAAFLTAPEQRPLSLRERRWLQQRVDERRETWTAWLWLLAHRVAF